MSDRHTDAAFPPVSPDMAEFLAGIKVRVRSGHITFAQWLNGRLVLTFDGGARYGYPCSPEQARAFALAPSKGGFLHDEYLSRGERGVKL